MKIDAPVKGEEFSNLDNLDNTSKSSVELITDFLISTLEELTYQHIEKLHQVFGHVSTKKLEKLIENSNRLSEEVKGYLKDVELKCTSCKLNTKVKPRPKVSLPRASAFNQVVTIDLKHYSDGTNKYILYLVDMFSRLIAGSFIQNKKPSTVMKR